MLRRLPVLLGACLLVFFSGQRGPRDQVDARDDFVPMRPELTRVLMKSSLPMVVDIYWLRALNAMGTCRTEGEFRNLSDFAHVLTTLDPDFDAPYYYLALVMPFNRGREDWTNGELAIELLQRGVARFPKQLRMRLLLGYSLMTFTTRHVEAARAFEGAAALPGSPPFAGDLAARLYLKGGEFDTALGLAQAMRDNATTPEERASYQNRVTELLDEAVLRTLDVAGATFHEKNGRYPSSLSELVDAGLCSAPAGPRFAHIRFDVLGRAMLPESRGRMKVFHDSFGGRDDDAPETWR